MKTTVSINPNVINNFRKAFTYLRPQIQNQGDMLKITYKGQDYKIPLSRNKPPSNMNMR